MTKFLNISTDNTLGGSSASDDVVSSQKAIKDYVDNHSGGGAVNSVNGKTGTVVLDYSDVGALPDTTVIPTVDQTYSSTSSNAQSGTAVASAVSGKQATITGAATTITSSNLTTSMALISNSSGKVAVSSVTSTELGYVSGVTSAIQTQLNRKADVSLSNLNSTGKSYGSKLGMPSSRYTDLTLGASGSSYTAPANGWFCVGGYNSSAGTGSVTIRNSLCRAVSNSTDNEWGCACILPIKKGYAVYIDYKNITTWLNKSFIYAEGEK